MELKINWSKRALKNYIKIVTRIQENFGENSAKIYQNRFEHLIMLLSRFPDLGTLQDQKENLRGMILYRRTTIFYKIKHPFLIIINVLDNRSKK